MSDTQITVAKTAGFCFGVNRAVQMVYRLLEQGQRVCTLGPIIHNPQLVQQLADRGVLTVETPEQVPAGYTLVIRSHGVPQAVYEQLERRGIRYADATCPFVSKIHKTVARHTSAEIPTLIAGDPKHAEVIGICGYAKGPVYCIQDENELSALLRAQPQLRRQPVCVVAQTTFNAKIWEKIEFLLKKVCTNAKIFVTICDATSERQREAEALARKSDLMIVIGGRQSSNTKKLFDICNAYTNTVLLEDARELRPALLQGARMVGVTAGASTPAVIIKEVLNTMSDMIEKETVAEQPSVEQSAAEIPAAEQAVAASPATEQAAQTTENKTEETEAVKSFDDMTFEEALEESLNNMNQNSKVEGTVIAVGPTEVQVDIGRKYTGIIPAGELSNDPTKKPEDLVKVGDKLDLIIMKTNDVEGIITLSKRRYDAAAGFNKIVEAKENDAILDGTVTAVVKGGITLVSNGVRVFVPASHATLSRNDSLEALVGKEVQFRVLDIRRGRSVVGSIRSVLREKQKADQEKIWSTIAVGNKYTGVVKSLTSYGAFVDIGGVDGMVHITELSWTRIKHPSEVVKVGDTVEVYVKDLDMEKKKISLGFKRAEDNPWEILKTRYQEGDVAEVKVVSLTSYGAFANIIPGIDGLIHISQIADRRIEKPQDVLKVGDVVRAKITKIDYEAKRVSLSIRALIETEKIEVEPAAPAAEEPEEGAVLYSTDDVHPVEVSDDGEVSEEQSAE